jgi:CRISPR-associated protein Cas2
MRSREKLRWELEKILAPEDSILLIRLSHQCVASIPSYNRLGAWSSPEAPYRIV